MFQLNQSLQPDIYPISLCHQLCFAGSFSNKLGLSFTAKTFEWFLSAENRFLYHVTNNTEVVGYIGGFCPQYHGDGSTSGMMRYAMKEAMFGVAKKPWLLFSKELISFYPLILKNVYRKIFKIHPGNKVSGVPVGNSFQQKVGLVVIGVHPNYRGSGIFEMLMQQFEKEAAQRHISSLVLSVKKDNGRAVQAYKKNGWMISKENDKAIEMYKTI